MGRTIFAAPAGRQLIRECAWTRPGAWRQRAAPRAQSHVWAHYEAASCYGREVATQGGPRGPSRAYFVPSLSAVQLLLPAPAGGPAGDAPGAAPRRVYNVAARPPVAAARVAWRPDVAGGGGGQAVPLLEHFEAERPFERPALTERVAALAAAAAGGGAAPGRRLLDQPLAGLHPASWCGPRRVCCELAAARVMHRPPWSLGGCSCGGGARRPGAVARGAEARSGAVCLHSRTRRPKGR